MIDNMITPDMVIGEKVKKVTVTEQGVYVAHWWGTKFYPLNPLLLDIGDHPAGGGHRVAWVDADGMHILTPETVTGCLTMPFTEKEAHQIALDLYSIKPQVDGREIAEILAKYRPGYKGLTIIFMNDAGFVWASVGGGLDVMFSDGEWTLQLDGKSCW